MDSSKSLSDSLTFGNGTNRVNTFKIAFETTFETGFRSLTRLAGTMHFGVIFLTGCVDSTNGNSRPFFISLSFKVGTCSFAYGSACSKLGF